MFLFLFGFIQALLMNQVYIATYTPVSDHNITYVVQRVEWPCGDLDNREICFYNMNTGNTGP